MQIEAPFIVRKEASKALLELLEKTPLGTKGAVYWHLNTREIIYELDEAVFISLERHEKCVCNITFCHRNGHQYIRYFAFDQLFQTTKMGQKPSSNRNFKLKVAKMFENELNSTSQSFYAYIEPKNERSHWMRENFGFVKAGQIQTQTFSRLGAKKSLRVIEIIEKEAQLSLLSKFKQELFYTSSNMSRMRYFELKNEEGKILASCRAQLANWKIEQMGGTFGKLLTRLIPYLPFVNKLIHPSDFSFVVVDAVYVDTTKAECLGELFESLLAEYDKKVIFWWTNVKNPVLQNVQSTLKWGLMDLLLGRPKADLVVKTNDQQLLEKLKTNPFFVNGVDLI